jgi:hypothetical protein
VVTNVWADVSILEYVATASSGAVNASVFARRAAVARGPRRAAALLLASLFSATALDAAAHLQASDPGAIEVAARTPMFLATLTATGLLLAGAGR